MNKKQIISSALGAAILSFVSEVVAEPAAPQSQPMLPSPTVEKCYGVAGHNQNDCGWAGFYGEPSTCAGTADACNPAAWRWVTINECERWSVGYRENGELLYGTLQPSLSRGYPVQCIAYDPNRHKKRYGISN